MRPDEGLPSNWASDDQAVDTLDYKALRKWANWHNVVGEGVSEAEKRLIPVAVEVLALLEEREALVAALKATQQQLDYANASLTQMIEMNQQLQADLAVAQYQADQWLIQSAYCRKCHIWTRRKDVMHNFPPVCSMCKEPVTYGALTNQLKLEADLVRVEAERNYHREQHQGWVNIAEAAQARIAEHEESWQTHEICHDKMKRDDERIAELEGSLRWYAEKRNYRPAAGDAPGTPSFIEEDKGQRARAVLNNALEKNA